jgi:hypothetical protein
MNEISVKYYLWGERLESPNLENPTTPTNSPNSCPSSANLHSSDTNLTNYGIRSANLHSLSTNSPNYENWTWNKI